MVHLLRSIIIPGPLPHLISRCVSSCIPDTSRETPLPHLTLSTRIRNSGQSFSSLLPFVGCTSSYLWHVGSSSLTRDRTLGPLHWECRVLAARPPRKFYHSYFSLSVSDTVSLLSPKGKHRGVMSDDCLSPCIAENHPAPQAATLGKALLCFYPPTFWVLHFPGYAPLGLTSRHTDRLASVPGTSHHLTFSTGHRRPPQYNYQN